MSSRDTTEHPGIGEGKNQTIQLKSGSILEGRYLIQGVLGHGGMGAVYRARDMHFPNVTKLVAVKEMVNQTHDPVLKNTIVRNFEREANLLASLDHRAIPRIYDYFSLQERSYLVLEYIQGSDLDTLISQSTGFFPEERVIQWAIELCDVLSYLHNHKPEPIIFRDIKPSNIMINPQDHAILIDFGIAKHFQHGQKGTMVGTEGYSPPEQYRGEATPIADIYALGATMHQLLTKRDPRLEPPFSFGERPIRAINPGVSSALEGAINRALDYNPEMRFRSAEDMRFALVEAARSTGILSNFATSFEARSQPEDGIRALWQFQCEDEVRGSPYYHDGFVYFGSYDNYLYALNAKSGDLQWKYKTDGGIVSRPIVCEDNLIFGSEDHRLHAILLRNGKVNWTYYAQGPIRSSPHVAEGYIFIGADDGFLHVVNASTGRLAWKADCGSKIRSTPTSGDGLVYAGTESGDFVCLNFTGAVKWKFRAKRAVTSSPAISQDVVYFGSFDATLYALNSINGWVNWKLWLNKPILSSPAIRDNLLYIGSSDGMIYCIDINSNKEVWHFATQNQVSSSPLVSKDGLYCGSVDGNLYSLDNRTGRLRWKFKTNGPITGAAAASDDMIFIGSTDHFIYAILA